MSQLPQIRLRPTDTDYLNTQSFDSGSIFYDSTKNTLVLMDGRIRGGHELLKADLSNLVPGNLDFGTATITAQAFVGDGSALTNLPIPSNIATQTYVNTAVSTAFNTKATTSTLGTVKVDGTTILIDANGVISSVGGGGGGGGVDLTAFSVAAEPAASGNGSLAYNNTNGVFTYTPPDLSGYLTSYTETDTLNSVTTRGATTSNAVTISNLLTASSLSVTTTASVTGNVTLGANLTVGGNLYTTNIVNTGTGVPRWTSGSDFIIDAAGDVNVVGSKITNLATPTASTDAATKAYVDGAASAFSGGTVTGQTFFTNTTASSSTTTGAVTVGGGLGVAGDIYAGGLLYSNGSPVLTSDSGGYNGGIISGTVFVNNSTTSTSATTGALRVLGGVGIQGTLNTGPDAYFNAIRFGRGAGSGLGSNTNVGIGGGTGNDSPLSSNVSGIQNIAIGFKTLAGITNASNNTAVGYGAMSLRTAGNSNTAIGENALTSGSTSSNTAIGAGAMGTATGDTSSALGHDALKLSAGSGNIGLGYLAGSALSTGDFNVIIGSNTGSTIDGTSNNILIADGAGTIRISADSTGTVTIPGTGDSSSASTGALVVSGGVGIGLKLTVGGAISVLSTASAISTTSGALQVAGGIGAVGNIHAAFFYGDGSNLTNVVANSFGGGTVAGATSFTNNTASSSTLTGAVKVTGGVGVQGAVWAANFNGVIVPTGGAAPGANRFVRTDANGYTFVNYINSNTANNENPTVSQFIVQNATDTYYRKASLDHVKTSLTLNTTSNVQHGSLGIGTAASGTTGEIRATNNITAYYSSDIKFKENVVDIPNALEAVNAIGGKLFDWTDEYIAEHGGQDDYFLRKEDFGIIAQDALKVFPRAVRKRPDGSLAVDYEKLSALAFAAIVQLTKRVEELEKGR